MGLARDLYVILGDPNGEGAWAVRSYLKPLANWIWRGALVMAPGGLVSLTDRRFRIGAAARRAAPAVPAERICTCGYPFRDVSRWRVLNLP